MTLLPKKGCTWCKRRGRLLGFPGHSCSSSQSKTEGCQEKEKKWFGKWWSHHFQALTRECQANRETVQLLLWWTLQRRLWQLKCHKQDGWSDITAVMVELLFHLDLAISDLLYDVILGASKRDLTMCNFMKEMLVAMVKHWNLWSISFIHDWLPYSHTFA